MTVLIGFAIAFIAREGGADAIADVVAPVLTVAVVSALPPWSVWSSSARRFGRPHVRPKSTSNDWISSVFTR